MITARYQRHVNSNNVGLQQGIQFNIVIMTTLLSDVPLFQQAVAGTADLTRGLPWIGNSYPDYLLCLGANPKVSRWTLFSAPNDAIAWFKHIKPVTWQVDGVQ